MSEIALSDSDKNRVRRVWRIAGRMLSWGSNVALVLLLAATVAVLAAPHFTGWRYGILRSGSMSPAMPAGAAIVVAPAAAGDVQPGDVITFRSATNKDLLVTHRVYALAQDDAGRPAFVSKGDANNHPDDALVTADRLMGTVVFDLPEVGKIVQKLHTRTAFLVLIALPTALILALEMRELTEGVRDMWRGRKKAAA